MAKILIKRSDVSGFVPAKSDLAIGELQLNTTDGKLFMKRSVLTVESIVEIGKDAFTASKLMTGRKINGTVFDGTQDISFGTNSVTEESNLYYTQARFDEAFGNKTTSNLFEGTNLYYTQARFDAALAIKSTTNLVEGVNLYYTNARASAAAPVQTVSGRLGDVVLTLDDVPNAMNKTGDTMTGFLVLSANPTLNLHAATKHYVDTQISSGTSSTANQLTTGRKINNTVFDGTRDISFTTDVTSEGTTNLYYTDPRASAAAPVQSVVGRTGAVVLSLADVPNAMNKTGDTMTGFLVLSANPTLNLHAATKEYVDAQITGGTSSTANKLTTERLINGTPFDGTQDISFTTDATDEGTTNKYYLDSRARNAISVSGSLVYDTGTGIISYSTPVTTVFGRTGDIVLSSSDVVTALGYTPTNSSGAGTPGGAATLDANGKLLSSQIPAIAVTDTFMAASQSAMLGLTLAEVGDIAIRTDLSKSFILKESPYSTLANWQELLTPTDVVQSVAGKVGTVMLAVTDVSGSAPLLSPVFTGVPTAPTPATSDSSTQLATTAFVKAQFASPILTGVPTAPTPLTADNSTTIANTAYVKAQLVSPAFTGTPTAPTASTSDSSTQLATTAFVKNQAYAPLASPALTGTPTAPTASTSDSSTQLATTAFVKAQNYATTTGSITNAQTVTNAAQPAITSVGTLTTLTVSGATTLGNGSANYINVLGNSTGSSPTIQTSGTDTNVGLSLGTKGNGAISLKTGGGEQVRINDTAVTVNRIDMSGGSTGMSPHISARGADTNLGLNLNSQGNGAIVLSTGGDSFTTQLAILNTSSSVNYAQITGAVMGSGPAISVMGTDTNIDLRLTPKGTGNVVLTTGNVVAVNVVKSVSVSLTAVGSTQGTALALVSAINVVVNSTAVTGLGVVMPTGVAGLLVTVINASSNAINVYPAVGGQIDSLGTNVPFSLGISSKLEFVAVSATQWYALTAVYA